jgi:DNA-binding transcriptional ArsR family regulator
MMGVPRPLPDPLVELTAQRLRVLGQPVRVRILDVLETAGEITVQELADELKATQQNVSRHLGVLLQAGIVTRRRHGRTVAYRIADESAFTLLRDTAAHVIRALSGRGQ